MVKEPDIVKELREEEKLGKLQSHSNASLEYAPQNEEEIEEERNVFSGGYQRINEEIDLGKLEKQYRTIFENYAVAITLADEKERIVSWNRYAEELLNMDEKDLFLRNVKTLYPEEKWQEIRDKNIRQKGMKHKMETQILRKNKDPIDVEISLCVLKGINGKTVGSVGIIKDITELKRYEKRLIETEEKYKTIFENSAVAIMLLDEKERIVSWNKYTEKILGYTDKDLNKKPVEKLYPSEEWKKIRKENIREKGMQHHLETKIWTKKDKLIDVDISISVLKNHEGNVIGSIGIIRDISEKKRIEKELEIKHELLESSLNNIPDCIYFKDKKGRFIKVNKAKAERANTTPEQMIGKTEHEFFPEEYAKASELEEKEIIKTGKAIINKVQKVTDSKGIEHWISVTKIPRYNKNGNIIGITGINREITDIKKSEEKYERLINSSPDYIIETSADGNILSLNPAMSESLGLSKDVAIGKNLSDILPKKVYEKRSEIGKKAIKENKIYVDEDRRGDKHFHNIYVPITNNDGKKSIQCIARDITDQHKVEQALIDSEKRYRELFENAIDPIIVLDKNGVFVDVNNQTTKLLKYEKKDLVGKRFDKIRILDEKSLKKTMENFNKRIKGEEVPPYEITALTKNGEKIPAEINANVMYDSSRNEIIGDLVILRDIRERHNKEKIKKELNESERKFRDIFDATSDFLIYIEKGIILDINDAAMKICNLKKKDIVGKKASILEKFFSEEDMNKHQHAIELSNKAKDVNDYEAELNSPRGVKYEFLFSADCIHDEGEIKGILIRGKDITQRQRAWQELVKLEEKYRVLAETSADGVVTIDGLGRLTYVNPSFEKLLKRRKSQILATMLRDYLSEDSVYFFQQVFIDSRKKDEKIENVELEIVDSEGEIVPIEANVAPFNREDEFAGMVCTVRDITERRKVEDELKKSERLKTEFMNIAAHELKSPVTPIKGYLDLIISDEESSEKIKNWAKVSLRNSERLLRLVNDILDVSRLDTDTMSFEMIKLPIIEILDEIAEDMKASVEGKGLKFITEIPRDLPKIMGDRHRLSQVFKNIVVNALKFTDNGHIGIYAEKQDETILIKIEDTGIGISDDEVKKVFNKFYQAYTGDDRKNEGTGLGLFICREIIQKHKGDIWVESKIGKGSTFYIQIPYLHQMVVNLKG